MARLLESIVEVQEHLGGLGRTSVYGLIRDGHLKTVKIGRRTLVTRESLEGYVRGLAETDL